MLKWVLMLFDMRLLLKLPQFVKVLLCEYNIAVGFSAEIVVIKY